LVSGFLELPPSIDRMQSIPVAELMLRSGDADVGRSMPSLGFNRERFGLSPVPIWGKK